MRAGACTSTRSPSERRCRTRGVISHRSGRLGVRWVAGIGDPSRLIATVPSYLGFAKGLRGLGLRGGPNTVVGQVGVGPPMDKRQGSALGDP